LQSRFQALSLELKQELKQEMKQRSAGSPFSPTSVAEAYREVVNAGKIKHLTTPEWWAPAGLNRGGVPGATATKVRLSQLQRDTLYEGRINPIATFPGQGISVWGQKNLQRAKSPLDRINVRRLLISTKKFINV
jgi:hypothetical protein